MVFKRGRPDGQEVARQTRARRLWTLAQMAMSTQSSSEAQAEHGPRSAQESQSEIVMARSAAMETTDKQWRLRCKCTEGQSRERCYV